MKWWPFKRRRVEPPPDPVVVAYLAMRDDGTGSRGWQRRSVADQRQSYRWRARQRLAKRGVYVMEKRHA